MSAKKRAEPTDSEVEPWLRAAYVDVRPRSGTLARIERGIRARLRRGESREIHRGVVVGLTVAAVVTLFAVSRGLRPGGQNQLRRSLSGRIEVLDGPVDPRALTAQSTELIARLHRCRPNDGTMIIKIAVNAAGTPIDLKLVGPHAVAATECVRATLGSARFERLDDAPTAGLASVPVARLRVILKEARGEMNDD